MLLNDIKIKMIILQHNLKYHLFNELIKILNIMLYLHNDLKFILFNIILLNLTYVNNYLMGFLIHVKMILLNYDELFIHFLIINNNVFS